MCHELVKQTPELQDYYDQDEQLLAKIEYYYYTIKRLVLQAVIGTIKIVLGNL